MRVVMGRQMRCPPGKGRGFFKGLGCHLLFILFWALMPPAGVSSGSRCSKNQRIMRLRFCWRLDSLPSWSQLVCLVVLVCL